MMIQWWVLLTIPRRPFIRVPGRASPKAIGEAIAAGSLVNALRARDGA